MLDRAGLTGPDGPTHHGVFDVGYMRLFPNMTVMVPGDSGDLSLMLEFALTQNSPCSLRYPKTMADTVERPQRPIELGRSEVIRPGTSGTIICCGTQLSACIAASDQLRGIGLDVGVINARFVKPLDHETILRAITDSPFVVTVEESALMGGFGSAVLEAAADEGLDTSNVRRLGIPDTFVEHAERGELLADLGLDAAGIAHTCCRLAGVDIPAAV